MSDTSLPPHEDFVETLKRWEQERKAAEAFEANGRRAAPKEQRVVTTGFKFAVPGHGDIALPALTYGDFHWLKDVLAMEAKLGGLASLGDGTGGGITFPPIERKPWSEVKDALKPLLMPPDVGGSMSPEDCLSVAMRIEELSVNESDGEPFFKRWASRLPNDIERKVRVLVAAMRECAKRRAELTWS